MRTLSIPPPPESINDTQVLRSGAARAAPPPRPVLIDFGAPRGGYLLIGGVSIIDRRPGTLEPEQVASGSGERARHAGGKDTPAGGKNDSVDGGANHGRGAQSRAGRQKAPRRSQQSAGQRQPGSAKKAQRGRNGALKVESGDTNGSEEAAPLPPTPPALATKARANLHTYRLIDEQLGAASAAAAAVSNLTPGTLLQLRLPDTGGYGVQQIGPQLAPMIGDSRHALLVGAPQFGGTLDASRPSMGGGLQLPSAAELLRHGATTHSMHPTTSTVLLPNSNYLFKLDQQPTPTALGVRAAAALRGGAAEPVEGTSSSTVDLADSLIANMFAGSSDAPPATSAQCSGASEASDMAAGRSTAGATYVTSGSTTAGGSTQIGPEPAGRPVPGSLLTLTLAGGSRVFSRGPQGDLCAINAQHFTNNAVYAHSNYSSLVGPQSLNNNIDQQNDPVLGAVVASQSSSRNTRLYGAGAGGGGSHTLVLQSGGGAAGGNKFHLSFGVPSGADEVATSGALHSLQATASTAAASLKPWPPSVIVEPLFSQAANNDAEGSGVVVQVKTEVPAPSSNISSSSWLVDRPQLDNGPPSDGHGRALHSAASARLHHFAPGSNTVKVDSDTLIERVESLDGGVTPTALHSGDEDQPQCGSVPPAMTLAEERAATRRALLERLDDEEHDIYIDTKDLCHRVPARRIAYELKQFSIPQAVFADQILGRSQGTLSDLLRNPKPWNKLKSGRETFRRMYNWLRLAPEQRLQLLDLYKLPPTSSGQCAAAAAAAAAVAAVAAVVPASRKRRHSDRKVVDNRAALENIDQAQTSSDGDGLCSPGKSMRRSDSGSKRHRLVFSDIQKRTLQAIFKETQRPSREMQQAIAEHLKLDLSTVANYFMNARRRSRNSEPFVEDEPEPNQLVRPITPPPLAHLTDLPARPAKGRPPRHPARVPPLHATQRPAGFARRPVSGSTATATSPAGAGAAATTSSGATASSGSSVYDRHVPVMSLSCSSDQHAGNKPTTVAQRRRRNNGRAAMGALAAAANVLHVDGDEGDDEQPPDPVRIEPDDLPDVDDDELAVD